MHFKFLEKLLKNEKLTLLILISLFIIIRSINFQSHLNFSTDQAVFSIESLRIYNTKDITFVGPRISIEVEGKHLFQGSVVYYMQLLFLILGGFDPVKSSYAFMFFSSLMVVPLYFGTKWQINQKAALLFVAIFSFAPYFINYTRFLWNTNFQLSLLPLLVFVMGKFHKEQKYIYFFLIGVLAGILLQFHYQFFLILIVLGIYYFLTVRLHIIYFPIGVLGFITGFLPMIIFELKNNFYSFDVLYLYLTKPQEIGGGSFSIWPLPPHYRLSLSFFVILGALGLLGRFINTKIIVAVTIGFLAWSLYLYVPQPSHAYGMAKDWNFLYEKKVYEIIKNQNLSDYAIANTIYGDTVSSVQRYLHLKDGYQGDLENYFTNKYLFIIMNADQRDYMQNPAYEISWFVPSEELGRWAINSSYNLYLRERKPE